MIESNKETSKLSVVPKIRDVDINQIDDNPGGFDQSDQITLTYQDQCTTFLGREIVSWNDNFVKRQKRFLVITLQDGMTMVYPNNDVTYSVQDSSV